MWKKRLKVTLFTSTWVRREYVKNHLFRVSKPFNHISEVFPSFNVSMTGVGFFLRNFYFFFRFSFFAVLGVMEMQHDILLFCLVSTVQNNIKADAVFTQRTMKRAALSCCNIQPLVFSFAKVFMVFWVTSRFFWTEIIVSSSLIVEGYNCFGTPPSRSTRSIWCWVQSIWHKHG